MKFWAENRLEIWTILMLVAIAVPGSAQVKFLEQGQKGYGFNLNYARAERINNYGLQLELSSEGRVGVGLLAGISNPVGYSPIAKLFGVFAEGDLIKAARRFPIGVTAQASYTHVVYSGNGFNTFQGQTIALGLETYWILLTNSGLAVMPSVQVSRVLSRLFFTGIPVKQNDTAIGLNLDFIFGPQRGNALIFSPTAVWIEETTSFGLSVGLIFRNRIKSAR